MQLVEKNQDLVFKNMKNKQELKTNKVRNYTENKIPGFQPLFLPV